MDSLFSKTIKSGKSTYFVDVREAKNKSKYITLTESSPSKDGGEKKFSRKSIVIFENATESIRDALTEAATMLKE